MLGYDETWLDVLACPVCHGQLKEVAVSLRCTSCERTFPIRDGVPYLIAADAPQAEPDRA
jgi:uncharacterized protein YbaR (Trm112 family)